MNNKSSIYQNLIDNYNISNYDFIQDPYNEKSIMSIIFSKFITDNIYTNNSKKYIDFILKENNITYYQNEIFVNNTYYYEDNMRQNNSQPSQNILIIDYDISYYASDNIKYYLLYLDIISQIYIQALNSKDNIDTYKRIPKFNIKCRYNATYTSLEELLLKISTNYNISIEVERKDDINFEVSDIKIISNNVGLRKIIELFKIDIIKHIKYLREDDVDFTNKKYLENISYFYKFCRIKLMYSIIHSIYILSLHPMNNIKIQDKVMNYIVNNIFPVFSNFKENIYYLNNDDGNISRKKLLYNKTVVKTTNKIEKINQKILNHKLNLTKDKKISNTIDGKISDIPKIETLSFIILLLVVIISIIINLSEMSDKGKSFLFSIIIYILISIYIIVYIYLSFKPKIEEQFENLILYPSESANTNNFSYIDGAIIRIESSDNNVNAYKLFDRNDISSLNIEISSNTFRNEYKGEYIKIDLGEYILLNNYTIKGNVKNFRIYATNDNIAWSNVNHSNWVLIDDKKDVNNGGGNFIISNILTYRYFMIIINQITNGTTININSWELYGNKILKSISLRSSPINISGEQNKWLTHLLPEINLPSDYDDIGLVSYDISANAIKSNGIDTYYGCIWTNIIGICLPSMGPNNILSNILSNLRIPLKNKKITAYIDTWSLQTLQNIYYEFNIKYYQSVSFNERFQILNDIIDPIEKYNIAEKQYYVIKKHYDFTVTEINKLNNELKNLPINSNNLESQFAYKKLNNNKEILINIMNLSEIEMLSIQKILQQLSLKGIDIDKMVTDFTMISNIQQSNIININDFVNILADSINKFNQYLINSKQSQNAMIVYYNAEYQNSLLKNDSSKLSQQNAQIAAEEKNISEEVSRNAVEESLRKLDNIRNNILIQQLEIKNSPLISQIIAEQRNIINAENTYQIALNDKKEAENKLLLKLSNSSQVEIKNYDLQAKIASEKAVKTYSDKQFSINKLEKLKQTVIDTSVQAIININNKIIADITGNIDNFNNKLKEINNEINNSLVNKNNLEQTLKRGTNSEISNQLRIENYKIQKNQFIQGYIKLCITREEKARATFIIKNNKEKLTSDLTSQIDTILQINIDNNNKSNSNSNISKLFKDIDAILLNNINDYINEISENLILPSLEKEYKVFSHHEDDYSDYVKQSKFSINVKKIDNYKTKANIHFYLLLSISIVIVFAIYHYLTLTFAIAASIILFTILITIYYVQTSTMVRTKAKNKYWKAPKKLLDLIII